MGRERRCRKVRKRHVGLQEVGIVVVDIIWGAVVCDRHRRCSSGKGEFHGDHEEFARHGECFYIVKEELDGTVERWHSPMEAKYGVKSRLRRSCHRIRYGPEARRLFLRKRIDSVKDDEEQASIIY